MGKRILLLTASTGAGHVSASRALRCAAEREGAVVEDLDCMDHTPSVFRSWFRGGYEMLVRRCPSAWGHLYRTSDRPGFNFVFQTALDRVFMSRLEPAIRRFRPDWVVCTHSVPQPLLASLRRRMGFRVAVVVTDLYPHRMWLRGSPDLYCLPTEWSLKELRRRVGPGPRAVVTGIPIGEEFRESVGRHPNGKLKVLLSAGGIGAGPVVAAAKALANLAIPMRVDVLCGANDTAFRQLNALPNGGPVEIHAEPLLPGDQVAKLMREADLFIGKSGGLTTSEALACGLPFVVLDPVLIPGQEELNAVFLADIGAGVRARTLKELPGVVKELIEDPKRLRRMRAQAARYARPSAASDVVHLLD